MFKLEVGEYFRAPIENVESLRQLAYQYGKEFSRHYVVEKRIICVRPMALVVRVWRTQ